ncbi:hypothetical protein DSL72_006924 [Monilinia vaccinii-corymbosi]|uniref:Uncharacterized protein n=1 Tax=Monilinia vaccinii-corymbosi TaxID=61207 RepID=A0A8A3PKB2_9HELO|nr:hypothetical protein DSL72_006924 [Monilinia vaccinii-corymbosi]
MLYVASTYNISEIKHDP